MNIYMGYSKEEGPREGACLVFAPTAKIARNLVYPFVDSWFGGGFFDIRAVRLRDHEFLRKQMRKEEPHVIESPETCPRCHVWGFELTEDGASCLECADEEEE